MSSEEPTDAPSGGSDAERIEGTPGRATRRAAEALLLVTEEPLRTELLAQLLELSVEATESLCIELAAEYDATDRGFQLVRVAGGWRYQTHPDVATYIERFVLDGQSGRLSNAALETLSIVAYKQPISRAQVAAIRGVNVDGVMRTLTQRGYIDEVGRDPGPGQAVLYGTTPMFLEKLGLDGLDELPPLGGFVPSAEVYEALEQGLRPDPDAIAAEATAGAAGLDNDMAEADSNDAEPAADDPIAVDPIPVDPIAVDPAPVDPAGADEEIEVEAATGADRDHADAADEAVTDDGA